MLRTDGNPMSHFFAQDLFANWAMFESLEPLISFLHI